MDYKKLTAQSRGDIPADLVIKNARVPNLFSYEIEELDVAISDGLIVGLGKDYHGVSEYDAQGAYLLPGFIEGHCHIESTMLTPEGFAELVLPHGTTTIFADPHEIANTSSFEGLRYMHEACRDLPVDIFLNAPSCIPASSFETPREVLGPESVKKMLDEGLCYGLGEMMNYPGVVFGDGDVWKKIEASGNQPRGGHAPLLSGKELNAYLLSRCNSDHECSNYDEAIEKLRRGCWIMLRQGAVEHNLATLARIVTDDARRASRCMMISDDLTAALLNDEGHLDRLLRLAVANGISPISAIRMVTLNTAEYNHMYDRGAVAPGYLADLVLVEDLKDFKVLKVWKNGARARVPEGGLKRKGGWPGISQNNFTLEPADLRVSTSDSGKLHVIGIIPGEIITENLLLDGEIHDGAFIASVEKDLAKLVVVNRNTPEKRVGLGFVKGLGLERGALGSSVAHDAHNFCIAGMDDLSIITALKALRESGGMVVTDGEQVLYHVPLPIAGLMSDRPAPVVAEECDRVTKAAKILGASVANPFMHLSFLSLSVIPTLKLTDQGYVDLSSGGAVSLTV